MISQFTPDNLFEGVLEQLQFLKKNGVLLALGSASRNGPNLLKSLGIFEMFDFIVNPTEVRGKPAPDIFLKASETLGIPIEQCIGIEDAYSGIEAIKSAGMYAVGIGNPDILYQADIVYKESKDIDFLTIEKQMK